MTKWNRFILPIALLAISLFIFVKTDALLWVAFLMFSVLSVAVNFFRFGRRLAEGSLADERRNEPLGVLGAYIVDSTELYGLFVSLFNNVVFIAIRQDAFVERREEQALYLFSNHKLLELSLTRFYAENPAYSARQVSYIGLHAKNMEQGEVFWDPSGYTILRDLRFLNDTET